MSEQLPATGQPTTVAESSNWLDAREGFLAMLPLWAGAILSGIAFGVAARSIGFSPLETQIMSLTVFSAAGQLMAVSMRDAGSSTIIILVTVLAFHIQFPLLGFSISRQLKPSTRQKFQLSYFLTDAAYGIAASRKPLRLYVLLGAGISMYIGWNLGTVLGLLTGQQLSNENSQNLQFVIPLTFVVVLIPQLRSKPAVLSVAVAVVATTVAGPFVATGVVVLIAGLAGCAAGVWLHNRSSRRATVDRHDRIRGDSA